MTEGIEKSKTFGLAWLLRALSMGGIKERDAAILAKHFSSMESILRAGTERNFGDWGDRTNHSQHCV